MTTQARLLSIMQIDKCAQLIEQVNQLHRQSVNALVATMVVLFYVAYRIHGELPDRDLWTWVTIIGLINVYLLIWIWRVRSQGINQQNVRRFLLAYQLEALLHGTAWGMLPFILANSQDSLHQLFSYYVICGMAAGAIATTGMIYRIYLSFMLTMMLPSIIWQIFELGVDIFDMGAIGLLIIFVVAMLFLSHAHNVSIVRGIRLLQQNEELVNSLREEAHRADAANRAKSEFLSNTSHELRTPLSAIMGFSNLLMKIRSQDLPKRAREYVRNIHHAGSHLSELINQVLDLARIETDKADAQAQAVHLESLLGETLQLMRPLAEEHQVSLSQIDTEQHRLPQDIYVKADPLRLRQVMLNLLSNSIKYNHAGGRVDVSYRLESGRAWIEVRDTGLGIPRDKHQEIFTPFTRVHPHLNLEGSGIGLAVTQKNLQMMGSEIELDSVEGKGSCFRFALPCSEPPEQQELESAQFASSLVAPATPVQVLYVEDNPMGLRLMQEVMGEVEGINLLCAETGEEGYRMAVESLPQVVILDINLPDISGVEVMRRLRANPLTCHIPALALSASAMDDDVERGLEAGFTEYLKKPCLPDEIVSRVLTLARRQQECHGAIPLGA